ncbi:tRNA (adenosine(37)-N6)-threonylcarbamoyltransferase complex transferase subunit TsaD [Fervidibacter sacchari]|uniref:tRNA N6-adenosine threonylcarbamoyltransferase n=1 Tax=Candidatus Fervidibacter sacchari TaxID=1448929 RepID=A0ABT2ELQ9_9BACT|nr:tRNA (adenosine(37)-N6)-threonylcarbamoyltransferase complex transferase subunit TsaD [Candidatus Fervidibacter sacchari]MCS3917875.1 N6-L-threonylcarbamoyladenine synthase [Candidatus Fervidibacter sacchari]WKU15695.1 tRNA (adenosine(37)-N6)-threonylcarbamoyltransferase complex transferase subunit TsaD [Candidatus Fervidibacter sacchari]
MLVLGIETSCDETSAAVVENKVWVRSNIVLTQTKLHEPFGGIVPEIASRKQMEFIAPVVQQALSDAGVTWRDLDAVAVTNRPGLIGSLVVGVSFAKAVALTHNLPLIPINHLEGHVFSVFLKERDEGRGTRGEEQKTGDWQDWEFPFLCLLVSGGHTELIWVKDVGDYEVLGRTRDDAAGEAFDKVARALGLGFPGGPAIDKASENGDPNAIAFPRADLTPSLDFSFAGLKTAVVRYLKGLEERLKRKPNPTVADIAASFQEAVVDMLLTNLERAAELTDAERVAVVGGVAANRRLRQKLLSLAEKRRWQLALPELKWCTDNAAMIACAASFRMERGLAQPNLLFDAYAVAEINDAHP